MPLRRRVDHEIELIPGTKTPFLSLQIYSINRAMQNFSLNLIKGRGIIKLEFLRETNQRQPVLLGMGLLNFFYAFCTLMNQVFHEYLEKFVVMYLDDIVLSNSSLEEHVEHLRLVFNKLRENPLYLNST